MTYIAYFSVADLGHLLLSGKYNLWNIWILSAITCIEVKPVAQPFFPRTFAPSAYWRMKNDTKLLWDDSFVMSNLMSNINFYVRKVVPWTSRCCASSDAGSKGMTPDKGPYYTLHTAQTHILLKKLGNPCPRNDRVTGSYAKVRAHRLMGFSGCTRM